MNEEQPRNLFSDVRTMLAVLTVLVRVLATSVEVFLHGGMGLRYLGFQALGVLILVPFYSIFWEGYDVRPLLWFMGAYLVMCAVGRIGTAIRTVRGRREHSYYSGYPRIMRLLPWLKEMSVKQGFEPFLVFLTGVCTLSWNQPLGSYLMLAASGLFASVYLNEGYDRQRIQDLYDNYLDQRNLTERFSRMRGDPF